MTLHAWQADIFGQVENDLFLAREADHILSTGSKWQDEIANAPEFGHDVTAEIADALADAGYTVQWYEGVHIYYPEES